MALRVLILCGVLLGGAAQAQAPPPVEPSPGAAGLDLRGQRIGRVEVRAGPEVDRKKVLDLAGLSPGDRLSLPAVQRAIVRLYGTGLFSEVIVRAKAIAGLVVVTLELLPRKRLRQIDISGNSSVSGDDLRKDFNFTPDQEFTPETLEALRRSVLESYRQRGFHRARVELRALKTDAGRVRIQVDVQEGERTRVTEIRFPGTPLFPASELLKRLKLFPGDYLDRERLRDGVDALHAFYRKHGFYEAQIADPKVELPAEAGGAVASFPIEAGQHTTIRFIDAAGFQRSELLSYLKLEDERRIDEGTVSVLRQRLTRALQERGFHRALVGGALELLGGKRPRKRLTFRLQPGPKVRVVSLRFPGAKSIPAKHLREVVLSLVEDRLSKATPGAKVYPEQVAEEFSVGPPGGGITVEGYSSRPLRPRQIYVERAYRQATEEIVELYKTKGFTQAQVDSPKVIPVPRSRNIRVEIPVREGVRTIVRSIRFKGNRILDEATLRKELQIAPGQPFNPNQVEESRSRVHKRYQLRGHIYARVEDQETFSDSRAEVDLLFDVYEGTQVRVGRIFIEGNVKTKDAVILDVLEVEPGDIYNPELISRSQQSLFDLGIFTTATLERENPDLEERYKNVVARVRERKPGSVETGVGFSTGDGPRGFVNLTYANLWGYNLTAQLFLKLNYQLFLFADDASRRKRIEELKGIELLENQATFSLGYPKILGVPFPLGARLDFVQQRRRQLAFNLDKNAVLTSLEVKLLKRFTAQFQYEFENSHLLPAGAQASFIEDIDRSPFLTLEEKNQLKRVTLGTVNLGSIRQVISLDLRDSAFDPRSGFFLSVTGEYTTSATPSPTIFVNYVKVLGTMTGYVPLGGNFVLALQAGGGRIFHLSTNSRTPAHKAFFLGGRGSLRGYPEESVIPEGRPITPTEASNLFTQQIPPTSTGGDVYLIGKAELRFPMAGKLSGALFFDVGNLWLNARDFDLGHIPRMSAGFGLRYPTPVGPLSLDYGVNLSRRFVTAENPDSFAIERIFYEGFGAFHFSIGVF